MVGSDASELLIGECRPDVHGESLSWCRRPRAPQDHTLPFKPATVDDGRVVYKHANKERLSFGTRTNTNRAVAKKARILSAEATPMGPPNSSGAGSPGGELPLLGGDIVDGAVDFKDRPARRSCSGGWRSASFIIGKKVEKAFVALIRMKGVITPRGCR